MKLELKDIKKLSSLARIEIAESEEAEILLELQAIMGYISEIEGVVSEADTITYAQTNITREDSVTNTSSEFTESILENAPKRNGNLLQVDQVI